MNQSGSASDDRLIGQVIADRYHILSPLGEGGMGRVYLAEHVRMGRKSAVKVMSPNMALSADAISRFNREAANASRINHPNVVQTYDFGETQDGMLYLAMEYVEGETLRRLVERVGPLPVGRAAELTRQIADGLSAAHHLGIVHRDLKPDNILLTRTHDGSDWVKVVDFGIAKTVQGSGGESSGGSQTVTTAGVSLGTPEYMSPEQLAGDRLDNRTDLFSLGLVLFNMLTGNLPYPRITSKETLVRRLVEKPMSLGEVAPNVSWPAGLQHALDRALAPELADRYASVSDFARDVVSAANGTVTLPARPGLARPLQEPTQRIDEPAAKGSTRPIVATSSRRSPLIAAGIVLLLGAAGAGAYLARSKTPPPVQEPTVGLRDTAAASPPAPVATQAAPVDSNETAPSSTTSAPRPEPKKPVVDGGANRVSLASSTRDAAVDSASKSSARTASTDSTANALEANGRPRRAAREAAEHRTLADRANEHFRKAAELVRQGDVPGARAEYLQAAPIIARLRRLTAGTPAAAQVEQALRSSSLQSLQACRAGMADSAARLRFPANFRCEQLLPPTARGLRGGRGNPLP